MSGPLPTFAATAALGRTSSQPSASMRTSTPLASANFFVFAAQVSSSPWTKRFQRSTRSFAPFSGVTLYCCACALAVKSADPVPSAPPAATPAVAFRKSRRLNLLMVSSSEETLPFESLDVVQARIGETHATSRAPLAASNRCARPRSGFRLTRSPARQVTRSRASEVSSWPLKRQ